MHRYRADLLGVGSERGHNAASHQPSLVALLTELKENVGDDQHLRIDALITQILNPDSPREKLPIPQPPTLYALPSYSGARSLS